MSEIITYGLGSKLLKLISKSSIKKNEQFLKLLDELPKKEIKLTSSSPSLKSYNISNKEGQLDLYRDTHYKENMSGDINFKWGLRAFVTDDGIYIGKNKLDANDLERLGPAGVKKLIADLQDSSNTLGEYATGLGRNTSLQKAFKTIYLLLENKYPKRITLTKGRETTEGSEKARELIFGRNLDFYSYPYKLNPEYRVKTAEFNAKEYHKKAKHGIIEKRKYNSEYADERGINEYRAKVANGELTPEEETFLGIRNGDLEGFDKTYLGVNFKKPKNNYSVKVGNLTVGRNLLKSINVVVRTKNNKPIFYRMDAVGKPDTTIKYTQEEVLDKLDEFYRKLLKRRQSWEKAHYPNREFTGDRFKIAQDNAELLDVTLAEIAHREEVGSNNPFSMYPFSLNPDPVPFKDGGKLDLIKLFKQGGLINNLNKPLTWEEYQKLNRQK